MRVTKSDKEAIVRAIVNDIPVPHSPTEVAKIQAALVKAMSPECRKVYKKQPSALKEAYMRWYDMGLSAEYGSRTIYQGDAPQEAFDKICEPYKKAHAERREVISKVKANVMCCTSTQQLMKRLPEFEVLPNRDEAHAQPTCTG